MTDATVAAIARQLAAALAARARTRSPDDAKLVAQFSTELVREAMAERDESDHAE